MATQTPSLFLERWLRNSVSSPTSPSPVPSCQSPAAQEIIRAWSNLRDCLNRQSFEAQHLQCLQSLNASPENSLHVADPQAKLLVSVLSLASPQSHSLIFRLLYIWLRKSSNPSPTQVQVLIPVLSRLLAERVDIDEQFLARGLLLLGAVCLLPGLPQSSRRISLDLLCRLLEEGLRSVDLHLELVPEVLAAIGYALIISEGDYVVRIFNDLLEAWRRDVFSQSLSSGLMLLHLIDWVVSGFVHLQSTEKVEVVCHEVGKYRERNYYTCAVVMAAAGILRALNSAQSGCNQEISPRWRNSVEDVIASIALDLISSSENFSNLSGHDLCSRLSLQCISLGLARIGPFSFHPPILLCSALSLLVEVFPLPLFCKRVSESPDGNSPRAEFDEVKGHVDSLLFREAGAITNTFCNQYLHADEENKLIVENYIWNYCLESYSSLRWVNLVLKNGRNDLLSQLEKIAEAAFLMVVVFASVVAKHKVSSSPNVLPEMKSAVSIRILVAFSCFEHLRRSRIPEYSDTIRAVVKTIQEYGTAAPLFVKSMPSYANVTSYQGLHMKYIWSEDEVQTARILFYLRVIPTCIEHVPHDEFAKLVAPNMFLYLCHPTGKVARASHMLFASFISSGRDSNQEDRMLVKEQLVFYYMQRALQAYPGITPYEGMASGITALVRHLHAGSPAIFYSIHSLAQHATSLCIGAFKIEADFWKNWQGEPSNKLVELLLRLISLVDIQVLPDLLKVLAQFIVQLPNEGQNLVLDEIYSLVAESDDVTRKPSLVSWLHSLSYLCSNRSRKDHNIVSGAATKKGQVEENASEMITLNRTRSKL